MVIYKITNIINQKVYIGLTRGKFQSRIRGHKARRKQRPNHPLYNSMNKYGLENFKFEEIFSVLDSENLGEMEIYFVDKYKSNNPKFGYNLTKGGEINYMSEEGKVKTSLRMKELWRDHSTKEKWKKALSVPKGIKIYPNHLLTPEMKELAKKNRKGKYTGAENHNYGKPGINLGKKFTTEHKKKISQAQKGKFMPSGAEASNSKPVKCLETGEIFVNVVEAKKVHKGNIYKAARNGTKANGLHWEYIKN